MKSNIADPLTIMHNDLLRRHRELLTQREPNLSHGNRPRIVGYQESGFTSLQSCLASAGIGNSVIEDCIICIQEDSRLKFFYSLPRSAFIGSLLGNTIHQSFFKSSSNSTMEITALLNVFTHLLDGLVDETPEIFSYDREGITETLDRILFDEDFSREELNYYYPVVTLMYLIAKECIDRIRQAEGWSTNDFLKEQFADAVRAALRAEYESMKYQQMHELRIDIDNCRRVLNEKSENSLWAKFLIPFCMHGLPDDFNLRQYRQYVHLYGRYVGWIDDIRDIPEDIQAGRWSNVLLTLFEKVKENKISQLAELKWVLMTRLACDEAIDELVETSVRFYEQVVENLITLDLDCSPMLTLLSDLNEAVFELG